MTTKKKYLTVDFGNKTNGNTSIYSIKVVIKDFLFTGKPHRWIAKLFASRRDPYWTAKASGKQLASIENDGNGHTVKLGARELQLDYSEAHYLELLLREARIQGNSFPHIKEEAAGPRVAK